MQYSRLLCFAALVGTALALPTPEAPKDDVSTADYTGAGGELTPLPMSQVLNPDPTNTGVAILNGIDMPSKRDDTTTQDYTGAGGMNMQLDLTAFATLEQALTYITGVAILNGVELPAEKRDDASAQGYTGAGGGFIFLSVLYLG